MKDLRYAKDFPVVCVGGSAGGLDASIALKIVQIAHEEKQSK
jgi:hypothetical protein